MTTEDQLEAPSRGRKRGGPLRINRDLIVEAARRMDPQTLTMQAVANELGVDRKALNYHVTDRDGLMRLVTASVFDTTFAEGFRAYFTAVGADALDDWRNGARTWAVTVRDSMVATGNVINFFSLGTDSLTVLEPAELVLQQMLRAGFDLSVAGRGLTFLTNFAMGVGRDIVMQNQVGEHPQAAEVRLLLEQGAPGGYDAFRGLVALNINAPSDIGTQFDFEVDVFIAGMESHLR